MQENKRFVHILPWLLEGWPDLDRRLARPLAWLMVALQRSKNFVLAEWARFLPTPKQRRVPRPKHGLLHRIKRVWRWVSHPRLAPIELQARAVPWLWKAMGRRQRWILLADWTKVTLRTIQGKRKTFHVFRVAFGPSPWYRWPMTRKAIRNLKTRSKSGCWRHYGVGCPGAWRSFW